MSQSNGLVASAKQNEAGGSSVRNYSRFPLSYSFYNTERFGEITPFFVEEGVSTDKLPLHSAHEVRTYTLQAPLMQSLLKKKDFFAVPMQAILPLNWEKFFTNPVIGEDVPDDCGLGVENFWDKVGDLYSNSYSKLYDQFLDNSTLTKELLTNIIRFLVFFEYFYSTGSLMETLGISGHNFIHGRIISESGDERNNQNCSFDDLFDRVFYVLSISDISFTAVIDGTNYSVTKTPVDSDSVDAFVISYREFIEKVRDGLASFSVWNSPAGDTSGAFNRLKSTFGFADGPLQLWPTYFMTPIRDSHVPLNLGRLWAYQLVCAHFYSNDHVDFIFSAELFTMESIIIRDIDLPSFSSCFTISE